MQKNVLVWCLAVLTLCGCSMQISNQPSGSSTTTAPATDTAVQTIQMPNLGPSPAPATATPAEGESIRLAEQDQRWQRVISTYPDATRPADPFTSYTPEADRQNALESCFTAQHLTVETGKNAAGNVVEYNPIPANETEAVAAFTCFSQYPAAPEVPPTPEQLGYLYDYLTKFLVPCYEANGIQNPPAPSRALFVAQWPHQNWYPSPGDSPMGTAHDTALNLACPQPH